MDKPSDCYKEEDEAARLAIAALGTAPSRLPLSYAGSCKLA